MKVIIRGNILKVQESDHYKDHIHKVQLICMVHVFTGFFLFFFNWREAVQKFIWV